MSRPIPVAICHAPADACYATELESHLSVLRHSGEIAVLRPALVAPGALREQAVDDQLRQAELIVLLLSRGYRSALLQELKIAQAQYRAGQARVAPVCLGAADLAGSWLDRMVQLPSISKRETADRDHAWTEVARGILQAAQAPRLRPQRARGQEPAPTGPQLTIGGSVSGDSMVVVGHDVQVRVNRR